MTIKSLFNWGGLSGGISSHRPAVPVDRWHSGWEHSSHGHGHGHGHHKSGGGKGSGAALSALALLAFLFLLNVMQQSLNGDNSTAATTGTTALLLREDNPISLTERDNEKFAAVESKTDDEDVQIDEINDHYTGIS